MNNYLNEKRIYQLIAKVEKSIFNGEILSCKLEGRDVYAIHEALMTLQQLVKLGILGFDDEGFVVQNIDNKNLKAMQSRTDKPFRDEATIDRLQIRFDKED